LQDTPETDSPTPRSDVRDNGSNDHTFDIMTIFVGRDGLRAGWSILIFLALFRALFLGTVALVHKINGPSEHPTIIPLGYIFLGEAIPFLCVLLATRVMARIERRPVSAYGYNRKRGQRNFCAGLASGVVLLSLLVVILRAAGLLVFEARILSGSSILRYGAAWLAGFVLVSLFEESFNRAYLQFTLTRGLTGVYRWMFGEQHANSFGFWTAALILSFAFGIGHGSNPGESPLGLLAAGLAGFLLCLSLWRTGSLWWAIGFHASWDWAQSFLYGVADSGLMVQGHLYATHPVGRPYLSGGLTGPEGSLFLIPIILAGAGIVLLTLPRTNAGYLPANTPGPSLH
jgi:uncharacterized protein